MSDNTMIIEGERFDKCVREFLEKFVICEW